MKVFGGLINCVRTFGNQTKSGILTLLDILKFSTTLPANPDTNTGQEFIQVLDDGGNPLASIYGYVYTNTRRGLWIRSKKSSAKYADLISIVGDTNCQLNYSQHGVGVINSNLSAVPASSTNNNVALFGSVYITAIDKFCLYPDYADAVDIKPASAPASGTIADNGWIAFENNGNSHPLTINGFDVAGINAHGTVLLPVKAGDTYEYNAGGAITTLNSLYFIPNRW